MLDLKYTREHLEEVKEKIGRRGQTVDWERFAQLDAERREILQESESLRAQRNQVSEVIAEKKKKKQDAQEEIGRMKEVSNRIKELETRLGEKEEALQGLMLTIPNVPHGSVAVGQGEQDNPEIRKWGKLPEFSFNPQPHWDIGEALDILDFNRGAKITGARFTLYKGLGARLERALLNFMLDLHTSEHGYQEVLPPFLVNRKSMTGTGQLPKFEEDLFKLSDPDYFLIPTAEVPVTNIHQDEILAEEELPLYYAAYTPCFRKEAGSYGKDTRGLIRQHQFNKVELVKFTTPESSYEELEKLTRNAEEVLRRLGIPYRVVMLCTGDLGFSASKTYDLEAWLPGQGVYREISSCSNFEDFQARRANIRYRPKGKKGTEFVHTLNGSGLAIGRTLVAILENFQQEDGSVLIPEALRPYMGGTTKIERHIAHRA
ncbi:MAG TPA: serine--tRNA ligase [Thermodesulfobacteriota bacterium]|nr:serine--tRNA ligase [Thermodesulfobacteriota bacterium]